MYSAHGKSQHTWPKYCSAPIILTLFHHANVHTAFESACLAVAPVVLGDRATAIKGTCEGGLALHTAPKEKENSLKSAVHLICNPYKNTLI